MSELKVNVLKAVNKVTKNMVVKRMMNGHLNVQ